MKTPHATIRFALLMLFIFGTPIWADEGEDIAVRAIEKFPRTSSRMKRDSNRAGMPIISVDLGFTKMTDAGLKELNGLKQLQILFLHRTEVTDAGLKDLVCFESLEKLYLGANQITDQGILELRKLSRLRYLDLRFTKVTEAGAAELQKALPQLTVFLGGEKMLVPKKPPIGPS